MKILSIETSCDETAVSVVEIIEGEHNEKEVHILGNALISQTKIHEQYGGVFPMVAKREHQRNLIPVLGEALKQAGFLKTTQKQHSHILKNVRMLLEREPDLLEHFERFIPTIEKPQIDLIAVTHGPGLEPTLWVGINFARALGTVWNIPVVPCNHMEGHVLISLLKKRNEEMTNDQLAISNAEKKDKKFSKKENLELSTINYQLSTPPYPALALLISGGHTELVLMRSIGDYKIIGETRDDAVGECFDKIARTLGLPYPGGPEISRLAEKARKENITSPEPLPRPMMKTDDLDFSFSGLKTAVLYLVKRLGKLDEKTIMGIARETEDAITDVLLHKAEKAIEEFGARSIVIGGGVIANTNIRKEFEKLSQNLGLEFLRPEISHSTDNALMIALAGFFNQSKAVSADTPIKATGNLRLG